MIFSVSSKSCLPCSALVWVTVLLALYLSPLAEAHRPPLAQVPNEIVSRHFLVTVDGETTPVLHAALNTYFLSFPATKHTRITVTAPSDDFWDAGVDVQPWRLGIRPIRRGRTLTFTLDGPAKISLSRPGDFLNNAEMLFLFADPPQKHAPTESTPGIYYIAPGVHIENLDPHSGETFYLAPGAVVFGSLNLWQVHHVRVFGPGVLVYDGPQNPADDDGWMHKRNWHCIVMDQATDISISDLTCVVRSRTWQIQMKGSHGITFDNIKVIGTNKANANADGMDWLGGGDTVVRNSFLRAADDVFALQSSWEGYGAAAFAVQGEPVRNVTIENTVVSTSISNIVRAAWPRKNFEGGNLTMRNIDVLHAGLGGCGVPFAFMELWADPLGRGTSANYNFSNIRLDDWYSLLSLEQPSLVQGVHFTDVASLRLPAAVPSVLKGDIQAVTLDNVNLAGSPVHTAADLPLTVSDGATPAAISDTGPTVTVTHDEGWLRPGQNLHLEAVPAPGQTGLHYTWLFGDGTTAHHRKTSHRFADAEGTSLDGSGLYHALLHITTDAGRESWLAVPMVVQNSVLPAVQNSPSSGKSGASFHVAPLTTTPGPEAETCTHEAADACASGIAPSLALEDVPHPEAHYSLTLDTLLDVPADGGYLFVVFANDASSLEIDGKLHNASAEPVAQVCGLSGNAARPFTVAASLAKGLHHLHFNESHSTGEDDFRVLWQGPGHGLEPIPSTLLHQP